MNDIEKTIEKLKFKINLLASTIDVDRYPIVNLMLSLDWDDSDLNSAHDVFEKYNTKIENGDKEISWTEFEHNLMNTFDIGHQTVKKIINAIYENDQWIDVCYQYSVAYKCAEFHHLIKDYEERYSSNS